MLKYILKRIVIFIPTLIIISLITFIISINAPGDPVESMLNTKTGNEGQASQKLATEKAYNDLRHQLGLDLPVFYFTITNSTFSDTLYKIPKANRRSTLERLAWTHGNWEDVAKYYSLLLQFELSVFQLQRSENNAASIRKTKDYINTLYLTYETKKIKSVFSNIDFIFENTPSFSSLKGEYMALHNAFEYIVFNANTMKRYIPKINGYGMYNQYHIWLFGDKSWFVHSDKPYQSAGFIRGDFGTSYQDRRPVASVLKDAIRWTLMLSITAILLAYLVAIPLGIKSAVKKGTRTERIITTVLFILYSLPSFWIATLLIMFFCGGDYLDWFPAFGVGSLPDTEPFIVRFFDTAYHLILPLLCWTYGSFAFISRQMRGGMLSVIGQDYIRTARAKGLDEQKVIWKHSLRNSLIPIITLFAYIFPLAISGSFVIEFIFSIPGMGKVSLEALMARNYPIIFTVMLLTGILTLIGTLVADILYATADPRISFSDKKG